MQTTEPVPDHDRECWALAELARQAATEPRDICRRFGEVAMKVCDAASAGVQLLDGECFRWEVLVGAHASQRSRLIPRAGCPSALCIDDGRSRRVVLSARAYPELACEPPVVEAVVVPFAAGREALGAAWIMTDRTDRHFGAEDERMLRVIADVASACWEQWKSARAAISESRRRDEIFATLVHELRNPLAAITAAACVIGRTAPPEDPAGQGAIDVVARQSRVLSRIVDDLSDLSRIACDKLHLRLEVLDVQPIVADAIVAAKPGIEARGQTLLITMPTEASRVASMPSASRRSSATCSTMLRSIRPTAGTSRWPWWADPPPSTSAFATTASAFRPISSARSSSRSRSCARWTRARAKDWGWAWRSPKR